MQYEHAIYEKKGPIAIITMNMPERLNAFNTNLARDVSAAADEFHNDPEIVVAILTGAGRGFSTGMDRKEYLEVMQLPEGEEKQKASQAVQDAWGMMGKVGRGLKPVVTAINGATVGGGLSVAMSGFYRVAAESAYFMETTLQVFPDRPANVHAMVSHEQGNVTGSFLIPTAIYHELLLGIRVSARRLYEVGIVNKVVPDDQLMSAAMEYAEHITKLPQPNLSRTLEERWVKLMGYEEVRPQRVDQSRMFTQAQRESAEAFMEKRNR